MCSLYFSGQSSLYDHTRPIEVLFRDPWWIYTVVSLLYNVRSRYEFSYFELMRISPTFAMMLSTMLLSVVFISVDIIAVTHVFEGLGLPSGMNPFWKLAAVFKCFTNTIVLDDFKTVLDRLKRHKLQDKSRPHHGALEGSIGSQNSPQAGEIYDLDISDPSEFRYHDQTQQPMTRAWKTTGDTSEHMDLEAALQDTTRRSAI